jgi:hypothetical protein
LSVGFRFLNKVALGFVILWAVSVRAQENDWLIVPGERLGPITSSMTRADLVRLFGKAQVRDEMDDPAEGPGLATLVFPKTPGSELIISWGKKRMSRVMICTEPGDVPCKWHAGGGITIGTSLERLETLNGRAFQIAPEQGEGQGYVTSWQGGKLAGSLGEGTGRKLWVQLGVRYPSTGSTYEQRRLFDEMYALKRPPLSSDPAVGQLKLVVVQMDFVFTAPPAAPRRR